MEGQGIGPDAAGARETAAVGRIVAPAHLQRIEAEPPGRVVDQHFRHRHGDRLTDAAISAGRRLVLRPHGRRHMRPFRRTGRADQGRGQRSLAGAAARMDRVGPGAVFHRRIEGHNPAALDGFQTGVDGEFPGMDVRQEGLQPVGRPFDRPAEQARCRDDGKLVGIGVQLDAEGAADIRADDPDPVQWQAELIGPDLLHLVRRLSGLEHRQRPFRRIVVGEHGAAFQRHAGLALEDEAPPGRGHGTGLPETSLQHDVAVRRRVGLAVADRRIGIVARRRHLLDFEPDGFGGVARPVGAVGNGQRDRFALVVHAAVRQRRLGRRPVFRNRRRARDHRPADRPQIVRRQHGGDAGQGACSSRIQRNDPAVGDRAAQEDGVEQARRREIAGEPAAAGHQPAGLGARERSVGRVAHG